MRTALLFALTFLAGCDQGGGAVTLYRTSNLTPDARIHIATFDAGEGITYNRDNCETAWGLFQAQPDARTRFWCEDGRYRK